MTGRKSQIHFTFLTVVCDIIAIALSIVASYGLRFFILTFIPIHGSLPPFTTYLQSAIVVLPVYIIFLRGYGLYKTTRHIRRIEEIFLVIKATTFSIIALMAITFFYRDFSYSRIVLIILWILSALFVSVGRYILIQWEYHRKRNKQGVIPILILGSNRNTRSIVEWAKNNPHYGHEVVGVLSRETDSVGKHLEGVSILGTIDECESFIDKVQPEEIILVDDSIPKSRVTALVALCENKMIDFKLAADVYGLMTRNVDVEYISSVPLLGFKELPLDDVWNRFVKRTLDLVVSSIGMILTLPIWVVIVLAIKLTDGGVIFYRQKRMGRDEKIFNVLKFRTMKPDAESKTGPVWAKADDDRRTAIGDFLRKWNLDELPQLINVLRGDMSLVGPRPERPHFIEKFRGDIPRYMARHKVKAGLTGWAQVSGYRGNTSIQERIKYDIYYMENWSLLFDIEIILMTFFAFKNAY